MTDRVPGHPGVTYQMLLKQIGTDITKDSSGVWTIGGIRNFRGLGPSKDPLSTEVSFKDLQIIHVREDGRARLLLFTNESGGDNGFDTLLAAYDDTGKVPKLVDYINVGGDRFNGIDRSCRCPPTRTCSSSRPATAIPTRATN